METFKNKIVKIAKKLKDNIKHIPKPFIGVILTILILISPLLGNKITAGHDYIFHATNNILTYDYIDIFKLQFTLPKIFGGNIANGFGYGTGIFYPPLSYYLTSYISYFLNLNAQNTVISITYLQILIIFFSGILMYKFTKRISKDNYVASISATTYITYSYFLCNIYTRTALAEALISVFLPLVFWGLYELFYGNKEKFNLLFTIGYIGMINSHLILSIFITIIILIIFLLNFKKVFKKDKLIELIKSSIMILIISSPYLIPLLEHSILGNYTAFEPNTMYDISEIKEFALDIFDFLIIRHRTDNGVEVYISYITLMSSLLTIIFNKKIFKKEHSSIYKNILLIVIISALISSKIFPWEQMPYFIKMIQFPWRLCGITSFGLCILTGYMTKLIDKKYKNKIACIIVIFLVFFVYSTISKEYVEDIIIPTQMSMGNQKEYLPMNTKNNLDYFENRQQDIILKTGNAEVSIIENNTPYLESEIILNTESVTIELPRIYYLGYKITLTDIEGNINKIKYYENEDGFIELEVNKSGTLEIDYDGTNAAKVAHYVSFLTIIISIVLLTTKKINYYKRQKLN